jgi:hypothetical protein
MFSQNWLLVQKNIFVKLSCYQFIDNWFFFQMSFFFINRRHIFQDLNTQHIDPAQAHSKSYLGCDNLRPTSSVLSSSQGWNFCNERHFWWLNSCDSTFEEEEVEQQGLDWQLHLWYFKPAAFSELWNFSNFNYSVLTPSTYIENSQAALW